MQEQDGVINFSASDLVGHLGCLYLTVLDAEVASGTREKPAVWDPLLEILWERGAQHEEAYLKHLRNSGYDPVYIGGEGLSEVQAEETVSAMRDGAHIICQGVLMADRWRGRADFLRRIETPSALGNWSYEVIETKLARQTKGGTILQLCLYSDLIGSVQAQTPERMYVVTPWLDFEPQLYRTNDYLAYYRLVRNSLELALSENARSDTYPDPKDHCAICRWRHDCDRRRREDDHLCLVAGASKLQISELRRQGVDTTTALAGMPLPLTWRPKRGAVQTYEKIREQARVQIEGRERDEPVYELLPSEAGFGLSRLPPPSAGDIFFDLEGNPYVGEFGLEYLFGQIIVQEDGTEEYTGVWAHTRSEERQAFESFVDFVVARWQQYPDLHIYHFAPYEPGALKRLMGRYATREEEIDQMLRANLFIDLYRVVRSGVRASVESYSIKELERFFEFERTVPLPEANQALFHVQTCLELADADGISEESRAVVERYNADDCVSTHRLRNWLERIRAEAIETGADIARPAPSEGAPSEAISEWQERINAVTARLTEGLSSDPEELTEAQKAQWLLANVADWHRREDKSAWWEYFRLSDLSPGDLVEERSAISGLSFVEGAGGSAVAPIHRYHFPPQETNLRDGKALMSIGGYKFGIVENIAFDTRMVDVKKRKDTRDVHPQAVFSHEIVNAGVLAESLVGVAEDVADRGIEDRSGVIAARDLLLRQPPRIGDAPIRVAGETPFDAAMRIIPSLEGGILPVQGPPGSGKTYTGARMICALAEQGARIGVTANSHKVVRNLLNEVCRAADDRGIDLTCLQKVTTKEEDEGRLRFTTKNEDVFDSLGGACSVAGGTAWLWARPDAHEQVDVLFVDEAAQMSLANVLAMSRAGRAVVLLGDPQQLEQPIQGSHPDGAAISALDYILAGHRTIQPDQGLFLEETWRLHPDICAFTSEVFYEGRLSARSGLEKQQIVSNGPITGSGLRYLPVEHDGNQSSSPEEANHVFGLVRSLIEDGASWFDKDGIERPITLEDILIVAPYNAQVFELQERLQGARIGTVDKFQGQEAPLVIYSMATSSPADAPHGMEFLYSLNRLNVATSRARCVSVLVGHPALFEPECRTPRQMQLANALCRYHELADEIDS